jgi:hypothetical protein
MNYDELVELLQQALTETQRRYREATPLAERQAALAAYREAVRRYTDLILDGRVPGQAA